MNGKILGWIVRVATILVLALGVRAFAQAPIPEHLRGVINDYTPSKPIPANPATGPWEVRGVWSLNFDDESNTASFSASLTMERSDEGVTLAASGNFDNPLVSRHAHTHHITVNGAVTHPDPAHPNSFRVTGPATITGNGNFPPPLTDFGPDTTLQIDITGGNTVTFSNIAVTFIGDAATHFGSQPFHGVVRKAKDHDSDEQH